MKYAFSDLTRKLSYEELFQKFEEALWFISDQQMEIIELHHELSDYNQAFEELQDELSKYR